MESQRPKGYEPDEFELKTDLIRLWSKYSGGRPQDDFDVVNPALRKLLWGNFALHAHTVAKALAGNDERGFEILVKRLPVENPKNV